MPSKKWQKKLNNLLLSFPYPWSKVTRNNLLEQTMNYALTGLNRMKHPAVFEKSEIWRSSYGNSTLPDYSKCKNEIFPTATTPLLNVLDDVLNLFDGMPIWVHPQSMLNVLPSVNTAAIISSTLVNIASPNYVEGEVSWNIAKAELESIAMIANLLGWNAAKAGGIFTFGGTGCYLYALKLALTKIFGKDTRYRGIDRSGVILVSKAGHYAKKTCSDWTGMGMDQVIEIEIDKNNAMDISHLQKVMEECQKTNRPIVMIIATMGTTDAFAIDPIRKIRKLINCYQNAAGRPKPFLYADAVIGWAWLVYKHYDFSKNLLEFSSEALKLIRQAYLDLRYISEADAMGIDFHKTGWCPYSSSLFVVKNNKEFTQLLARQKPAYISTHTDFNPYLYTLETSRSAAPAIAAWATLKHFGSEGFQILLGRIIEVKLFFKNLLKQDMICINPDNNGLPTLFRVYPAHINAKEQYQKELTDPTYKKQLHAYNKLQRLIANKLFAMSHLEEYRLTGWENPPQISLSAGYRPPEYNRQESNHEYWIFALKSFPVSPFANELSMLVLRNYALKARDLVIAEQLQEKNKDKSNHSNTASEWFGKPDFIDRKYLIADDLKDKPIENWLSKKKNTTHLTVTNPLIKSLLATLPYFYHLSDKELESVIKGGQIKNFSADQILCREGDEACHAYLVISGELIVYSSESEFKNQHILGKFGPGSFLGEMALFEQGLRSANIKTNSPATVFFLSGKIARFLSPER